MTITKMKIMSKLLSWLFFFTLLPATGQALEPHQLLVVANRNAAKSIGLAKYYMDKRGIPKENLLKVWVTDKEVCDRSDYDKKIAAPVKKFIAERAVRDQIRCLVLIYGMPLRIKPPELTWQEKSNIKKLKVKRDKLASLLNDKQVEEEKVIKDELNQLKKELKKLSNKNKGASVDSELTLVLAKEYPLAGWLPNPFFLGFKGKPLTVTRKELLMVSRLDAPNENIVKRIITDSLETEKKGLRGIAYFDARWQNPGDKKLSGYAFYDKSIHQTADYFKESSLMPTVLDESKELFQPGDCPESALYCGWYNLGKYVDAFTWQPGAIGYHIASSECTTLKRKGSKVWCKMMLEDGVAATIGPVSEPYVQAFPIPAIFFRLLAEHKLTLVESYFLSLPYVSWQMVLVGDPLYIPFKKKL